MPHGSSSLSFGEGRGEAVGSVGLCLYLGLCLLLVSCTKAEIYYPDEVPSGVVQIYPDMSEYTLPAVVYHFYNVDTQVEYITRSDDGAGNFEGVLPAGTYRVIATNTAAANVSFSGMDHYETAVVTASPQPSPKERGHDAAWSSSLSFGEGRGEAVLAVGSRAVLAVSRGEADYSLLAQPGNVYSTVIEELLVTEGGTVRMEPAPVLLTKRLNLVFSLEDGLDADVASMSGVLPGIYPAVHLYTHQGEQVGDSPGMAIRFETEVADDKRRAEISLFGIYDPARGESYTPVLELDLTMADGSTSSKTLDLTDFLTEVIEESGGSIPSEFSVSFNVKRSIWIDVEVVGWTIEGESKIEETSER